MCHHAEIVRSDCSISNVFTERPADNDLKNFSIDPLEWKSRLTQLQPIDPSGHWPSAGQKLYFEPERVIPELLRIRDEIAMVKPNLVVALGGTALWALTKQTGIKSLRGTPTLGVLAPGVKILATYHPAAIFRDYSLRVVSILDLMKAKREAEFPELRRPRREIWLDPTLEDLAEFERKYMLPSKEISIDIETKFGQIDCIGFAPAKDVALCLPFFNPFTFENYWKEPRDEAAAWRWAKKWCESPQAKIGQNFLYDIQYLINSGITPRNFRKDSMLLQHAKYSELPKDLGFLGSIYTDEPAWKTMRIRGKEALKKDD